MIGGTTLTIWCTIDMRDGKHNNKNKRLKKRESE